MAKGEGDDGDSLPVPSPGSAQRDRKFSLRQMQKELTRRRIIESALRIFGEKSFTAATLEDISAAGAVSRPTIYAHFNNKVDILRAAIDELPDVDPLLAAVIDADDSEARHLAFRGLSDFWHDHVCEVWKFVREAAAVDPQIMAWIEHFALTHTQIIATCLEKRGVPATSAYARAFLIWCSWHEYLFWINRSFAQAGREAMVEALNHDFESALQAGEAVTAR